MTATACPHCHEYLYTGERWHTHTGAVRPLVCCPRCKPGLDVPKAEGMLDVDFNVEHNFKAAGTSAAAAQSAAKSARLNDTHRKIYAALRDKPMTADEVSTELGLCLNTARARISDLKNAGHLEATGAKRNTQYGKPADVLRITQKRRDAA